MKKETIRRIREAVGMSQGAFAEVLRKTRRQVIRWENGDSVPRRDVVEKIERLARRRGIPVNDEGVVNGA